MITHKAYYILIRGPLGCGKSTLSLELAKELNAEYISIDSIVDNPTLIRRTKEEGYISQDSFRQANDIVVSRAKEILDRGRNVIFDGNFYWKSQIEDLLEKLKKYNGKVFTLKAPLETCLERDAHRSKPLGPDATKAVYKKTTSFDYGETIDSNSKTVDECINEILEKLRR